MRLGSPLSVWHVEVSFRPWRGPAGMTLSRSDNWNGKALVVGDDSGLDRSVAEVEIAARLRSREALAGWTGKPRDPWSRWVLDATIRSGWLAVVDSKVRRKVDGLANNSRGRPDVLRWVSGLNDFCCVEYKGPSPTNPMRSDTVKDEQEAWLLSACDLGLITPDRTAVVAWHPSTADAEALRTQAAASRLSREQRKSERLIPNDHA